MPTIHATSDVQSNQIGLGTRVWQNAVVLPGAKIGSNCNICAHTFLENDVVLGDNVTVKCGVYIWDGIEIGNDVFVGPNVTFTNDRFPRSGSHLIAPIRTVVRDGASIGAGAVILPGIVVGENSMIGAGAVVTQSVPANAIVVGNPARITGYVNASKSQPESIHESQAAMAQVGAFHTSVSGVTMHRFPYISDIRGSLTVGDFERSVPFTPKRYFMVLSVPSAETRGEHAHRTCHQFLICVAGSCAVVADDGNNRQEFLLDRPDMGLYLPPLTWGIQYKYSKDAVLLVFASEFYDAADYIREYKEFITLVGKKI